MSRESGGPHDLHSEGRGALDEIASGYVIGTLSVMVAFARIAARDCVWRHGLQRCWDRARLRHRSRHAMSWCWPPHRTRPWAG